MKNLEISGIIIKGIQTKGKEMEENYIEIGNINAELLKNYCILSTERLIITKERIEHVNKRHNNDYDLYGKYMKEIIHYPDYILEDIENIKTLLYLKTIENLNLQMVVKLQTEEIENKANTVLTFWHMRKRSYNQIIKKNRKIFDRNE